MCLLLLCLLPRSPEPQLLLLLLLLQQQQRGAPEALGPLLLLQRELPLLPSAAGRCPQTAGIPAIARSFLLLQVGQQQQQLLHLLQHLLLQILLLLLLLLLLRV